MSKLKFGKCKRNCCVCVYDDNCDAHAAEDKFSLASKDEIINRLDNKEHKADTLRMIRTLKIEYDYKYKTNYMDTQDWVSFDEVKPCDGQWVLGITSEGEIETYYYDKEWESCLCNCGGLCKTYDITHWMSLPEPPEGFVGRVYTVNGCINESGDISNWIEEIFKDKKQAEACCKYLNLTNSQKNVEYYTSYIRGLCNIDYVAKLKEYTEHIKEKNKGRNNA